MKKGEVTVVVAIVFGGRSLEHDESINVARKVYHYAIKGKLERKYDFMYFYLTENNFWIDGREAEKLATIKGYGPPKTKAFRRIPKSLLKCHVIYNTMMGTSGENGNIMGLADLLRVPIIGCDILASVVALDKHIAKRLVQSAGIPVVDYLYFDRTDNPKEMADMIDQKIKYPCFVKPTNLGTCYFIFKANDKSEFMKKWKETIKYNKLSSKYLIEKFVPNIEIRVFVFEDMKGNLQTNDLYATTLKEKALETGGVMFDHIDNSMSDSVRNKIKSYAIQIFKLFQMKDYGRIDFFVCSDQKKIYFNEANTQPFLSGYNFKLMQKQNGIDYPKFLDMMIEKNIKDVM